MSENLNYVVLPDALIEDLAGKKDIRFYLNSPYLDLRGDKPMLVATNGHLLAAASVEISGDVEQGPIPTEAIKRVRKDDKNMGINTKHLYFEGGRCGTGKVMFEREHMDCKYPDWTNIVKTKVTAETKPDITFDARYFKTMQDVLAPGEKVGEAGIAIFLERDANGDVDPESAFHVKCRKRGDVIAIIMPMRWN